MAYLQTLGGQVGIFCRMAGFGFLLGIGYDAVRLLRVLLTRGRGTILWDIVYGILAAVCTFLFDLTQNGGELRLYILLAECLGFLVWYICAGIPMRRCSAVLERYCRRMREAVSRPVRRLFSKVQKSLVHTRFRIKNFAKKSKFLLKFYNGLVYNLRK